MSRIKVTDVMLDLETLGVSSNAAVVAIGAVAMNLNQLLVLDEKFYITINLESAMANGGVVDASTILWWMGQSAEAREATFPQPPYAANQLDIRAALHEFSGWLGLLDRENKHIGIWGDGAAFDNVILANAYVNCGLKPPWGYASNRCFRTMKSLYPDVPWGVNDLPHHALADATNQAVHLVDILKRSAYGY